MTCAFGRQYLEQLCGTVLTTLAGRHVLFILTKYRQFRSQPCHLSGVERFRCNRSAQSKDP